MDKSRMIDELSKMYLLISVMCRKVSFLVSYPHIFDAIQGILLLTALFTAGLQERKE